MVDEGERVAAVAAGGATDDQGAPEGRSVALGASMDPWCRMSPIVVALISLAANGAAADAPSHADEISIFAKAMAIARTVKEKLSRHRAAAFRLYGPEVVGQFEIWAG